MVILNCVCVWVSALLSSIISDISVLKLKVDKCSRQDNLFMKKVIPLQFSSTIKLTLNRGYALWTLVLGISRDLVQL